jgi:hypothetical protein
MQRNPAHASRLSKHARGSMTRLGGAISGLVFGGRGSEKWAIADTLIERSAIQHHHLGQQDRLDLYYLGFHDRRLGLGPIFDEAAPHSTKNSTATNGPPSTHASRSREPPSV